MISSSHFLPNIGKSGSISRLEFSANPNDKMAYWPWTFILKSWNSNLETNLETKRQVMKQMTYQCATMLLSTLNKFCNTWWRFEPTVAEGRLLSVHNSTAKPPRLDSVIRFMFNVPASIFTRGHEMWNPNFTTIWFCQKRRAKYTWTWSWYFQFFSWVSWNLPNIPSGAHPLLAEVCPWHPHSKSFFVFKYLCLPDCLCYIYVIFADQTQISR